MTTTALIDGDILLYKAAYSVESRLWVLMKGDELVFWSKRKKHVIEYIEENGLSIERDVLSLIQKTFIEEDSHRAALYNFYSMVERNVNGCQAERYKIFFSGEGNFRKEICPEYKANRTTKPKLYSYLREQLSDNLLVEVIDGMEADDAMAINQTEDTCICSIDKDLLMVPGWHYNMDKGTLQFIREEDGIKQFYTQLLTGDRIDNIPGLKGIGLKRAEKILAVCTDEVDMYNTCCSEYFMSLCKPEESTEEKLNHCQEAEEIVLRNARLLWMVRALDEDGKPVMWEPPTYGV